MNHEHNRVAEGAALLDEQRPGWAEEIDLDALAMGNCGKCILGQLYGDFAEGRYQLNGAPGGWWAYDHGFDAKNGSASEHAKLRENWAIEIKRRKS